MLEKILEIYLVEEYIFDSIWKNMNNKLLIIVADFITYKTKVRYIYLPKCAYLVQTLIV